MSKTNKDGQIEQLRWYLTMRLQELQRGPVTLETLGMSAEIRAQIVVMNSSVMVEDDIHFDLLREPFLGIFRESDV